MYDLQERALHFTQKVWIVKEKNLLEMFQTSLSDAKHCASRCRNKVIFQSQFLPAQ